MRLSLIAATIAAIVISMTNIQEVSAATKKSGRFNRRKVVDAMLKKRLDGRSPQPQPFPLPPGYTICPDLQNPQNPLCAQMPSAPKPGGGGGAGGGGAGGGGGSQPVPPPSLMLPGFNFPVVGAPSLPTLPALTAPELPTLPDVSGLLAGTGLVGPPGGGSD